MRISQSEYARRRGVSRQHVSRLVKQGLIPVEGGKIDPDRADAAMAARREPARSERREPARPERSKKIKTDAERAREKPAQDAPATDTAPPPAPVTHETVDLPGNAGGDLPKLLLKTRIKSELEKGKLLEIKAKVEAGKYVDADEVKVAAFNKARIVRDGLLNIPDRMASLLAAETDGAKIHVILNAEIRSVLEELTGGSERI